jgi:hypothetical protein
MFKTLSVWLNQVKIRFAYATLLAMVVSTDAFAQINNGNIGTIFRNQNFQVCVTIGFGLFTFYKWVEYFANFQVSSALREIIIPAILTFLCFQWNKVLQWVGLM